MDEARQNTYFLQYLCGINLSPVYFKISFLKKNKIEYLCKNKTEKIIKYNKLFKYINIFKIIFILKPVDKNFVKD